MAGSRDAPPGRAEQGDGIPGDAYDGESLARWQSAGIQTGMVAVSESVLSAPGFAEEGSRRGAPARPVAVTTYSRQMSM